MSISYTQRGKQKLWSYRIFDKTKKMVASKGGFQTKTEAKKEATELEIKLLKGVKLDKDITLYQLWENWYKLYVLSENPKQSTLNKHLKRGKLIKEAFGTIPLCQIKASAYQTFINDFAKTNGKDNVGRLNSEIKKVLAFAMQDKIDFHDFTVGIKITGLPPKKSKDEKYIHSKADYLKLLNHLKTNASYKQSVAPYLLYVQLKTGMRFGEVLGLTWDCIDWKKHEIRTYRRYDSNHHKWTDPKTAESVRRIPLDEETLTILKRLKQEQGQLQLDNPDDMLFVNVFYGIPSNNAMNKYLQSVLQELHIEPQNMTCTGNRHTYASILISEGIDLWAIAKIMGHKDIKQLMETYGHLIDETAQRENEKIRNTLLNLNVS